MMAEPDPYRVLGVSKDASDAEIKRIPQEGPPVPSRS